jgi:hypothetical protein
MTAAIGVQRAVGGQVGVVADEVDGGSSLWSAVVAGLVRDRFERRRDGGNLPSVLLRQTGIVSVRNGSSRWAKAAGLSVRNFSGVANSRW